MKRSTDTIARVGLIANPEKPDCQSVVRKTAAAIARSRRQFFMDTQTAELIGAAGLPRRSVRQVGERSDILLVFGGDGTILRVAREIAGTGTPILGINTGGLGFLTAVSSTHAVKSLSHLRSNNYAVETRPLIEATRPGHPRQLALNDFVISRSQVPRLIELEVRVDGIELTRYRCDGLIVSSPTGSTAYSLAAGGAVVAPDAEVISLTPLCPHTLSIRPVIISLHSVVQVRVLSPKVDTFLSADGQVQTRLEHGETITIQRSRRSVRLARLAGSSFYGTLRQKLNWSGSTV